MKIQKALSLLLITSMVLQTQVWADDFVPEEDDDMAVSADIFILDADDTGNDVTLQFGNTLGESFGWDAANMNFEMSDSLDLTGNQIIDAHVENLSGSPVCDGSGTGRIYFNTTDSMTYVCDGTVWNVLENTPSALVEFPIAQARRTTNYTLTTSYTDVTLDTTDLENDIAILDHNDTTRDRLDIGKTAIYQIVYSYTAGGTAGATHESFGRVRVNDTTVLSGSETVTRSAGGQYSTATASFLVNLTAGDFVSLQLQRDGVTDTTQGDIHFAIAKLEGVKGDTGSKGDRGDQGIQGIQGPTGAQGSLGPVGPSGDIKWLGAWVSQNYLVHDTVEYLGSAYTCILNTTSNEDPTNPTYWEIVVEKGDMGPQGVPGSIGNGTDNETFTVDTDDTGGNLSLVFGAALNERITWDTTNSRFNIEDDLRVEGNLEQDGNDLTLDVDDTGGDMSLVFGSAANERLTWDDSNSRFEITDSLSLANNEVMNMRIENLATPPVCDTSGSGKIYYNTSDRLTYTCDGISTWNPLENALNATIEFPVVQARRTTSYALTTSYGDITFDTTDLENDTTSLDHDDTNRDRINIGSNAMYQIIYGYTAGGTAGSRHEARARVRVNDTTILSGSESVNSNFQNEFSTTSASFLANLSAGDYISLQLLRDNVNDATQDEIYLSVTKLEGIKGDQGDIGPQGIQGGIGSQGIQGPAGVPGDLNWQGTWAAQNYLVYDTVEYQGSTYTCIQNTESNENPTNPTYWELVSAKGDVGPQGPAGSAGAATNSEDFTIDADDTGGDLSLVFGTALNKRITWDTANSRFNIGDDLRVMGDLGQNGNNMTLDADNTGGDMSLIFGTTLAESLTWDNANNRFNLSDSLRVAGNLEQEGTMFSLDADNAGAGSNVDIVANQGTDNDGTLRYNAANNNWEFSNDGGTFNPLFVPQVFDAYDNSGGVALAQTAAVLNLDTARVADSAYTLTGDVVTFNQAGLYQMTGRLTAESLSTAGTQRSNVEMRFQSDTGGGFTNVSGAFCKDYMREQNAGISSASCSTTWIGSFGAGDSVQLTHRISGTTTGRTLPQGSGLTIEFIR